MPKDPADTEQQSYFYVVWPEESKSPGGTTSCTASAEAISTSSCNSNAATITGVASTLAVATTMPSLTPSQPTLSYEVADSRHNSSSSSIQSRSPEESPMPMHAVYNTASLPNKATLHGSMDECAKVNSNGSVPGIRPAHLAALSPSSAGGMTATSTYVIPSTGRASGRHKILMTPTDCTPLQRPQYKRESEAVANMSDIGTTM